MYRIRYKKKILGKVTDLIATSSNDVLVVNKIISKSNHIQKNVLIPFINKAVIKKVDITKKIIIVDWEYTFE
ncbi:MAG: PRC-barrel domain-containing protein [Buchnera aphidicola (Kaburagia rhusicola rhusicola)]